MNKNLKIAKNKVIVTAETNKAVDTICLKLLRNGVKVIRVMSPQARQDPNLDPEIAKIMQEPTDDIRQKYKKMLVKYKQKLKTSNPDFLREFTMSKYTINQNLKTGSSVEEQYFRFFQKLNITGLTKLRELIDKITEIKVQQCEVIACTLDVGLSLEKHYHIQVTPTCVLVDEATQIIESKLLMFIKRETKKLVLVGDQKQLGPIFESKELNDSNHCSMFERMVQCGHEHVMLNTQYRMHPKIAKNSSMIYYGGKVKSGVSEGDRSKYKFLQNAIFPKDDPRVFIDTQGVEEEKNINSFINRKEAKIVEKVLVYIMQLYINQRVEKADLPSIGVITTYSGQKELIKEIMEPYIEKHCPYFIEKVQIDTVDAFQGREVDFVIISCVRANLQSQIGFLKDSRRMNVAITRGRDGIIIIGNSVTLKHEERWKHLFVNYWNEKCYVKGKDFLNNYNLY